MRNYLILMSATALAACGGGSGPQAVGGVAAPAGPGGTPAPTHSFVAPTLDRTYEAVGSAHSFSYLTRSDGVAQYDELYAGDATLPRDGGITIAYSPRDAIFEVTINRPNANVTTGMLRFQDPVHRTAFGGARTPQAGVPEINGKEIQYLQSGAGAGNPLPLNVPYYPSYSTLPFGGDLFASEIQTFFYQKPGTTTKYVTYAGFVLNKVAVADRIVETIIDPATGLPYTYVENAYTLQRAAFAYGERSSNSAVPRSGSATFNGDMIATMIFNPSFDVNRDANTYFQWIIGSASHRVDFGTLGVQSSFTGLVGPIAREAYTDGIHAMPQGSTFTAASKATIDLVGKGGFVGNFDSASFRRPDGTTFTVNIGGSSIDGAFFGPNAEEIGGGFRIVGGTPDQRVDILGAYTGKK